MPKPPDDPQKDTISQSVNLTPELNAALVSYAELSGISKAGVMKAALIEYLGLRQSNYIWQKYRQDRQND